jgi:predicted Zn-dependent protease
MSRQLLSSLICAAALGGCASAPPPKPPATIASMMSEAEAAINLGKNEQAVSMLKAAADVFPADKAPHMRVSQLQFDCHNYGEAIFHAQQVLARDPDNIAAHSIIAASGLRVSSKALSDLAARNNVSGSVKAEAQDLVKLVRAHIKGDIVPTTRGNERATDRNVDKAGIKKSDSTASIRPAAAAKADGELKRWLEQ